MLDSILLLFIYIYELVPPCGILIVLFKSFYEQSKLDNPSYLEGIEGILKGNVATEDARSTDNLTSSTTRINKPLTASFDSYDSMSDVEDEFTDRGSYRQCKQIYY